MQDLIDNHFDIATPFLYRQCSTVTGGTYISDLNNVLKASGMKVSKQSLCYKIGCLTMPSPNHQNPCRHSWYLVTGEGRNQNCSARQRKLMNSLCNQRHNITG